MNKLSETMQIGDWIFIELKGKAQKPSYYLKARGINRHFHGSRVHNNNRLKMVPERVYDARDTFISTNNFFIENKEHLLDFWPMACTH